LKWKLPLTVHPYRFTTPHTGFLRWRRQVPSYARKVKLQISSCFKVLNWFCIFKTLIKKKNLHKVFFIQVKREKLTTFIIFRAANAAAHHGFKPLVRHPILWFPQEPFSKGVLPFPVVASSKRSSLVPGLDPCLPIEYLV
jgi:hypothetical protein